MGKQQKQFKNQDKNSKSKDSKKSYNNQRGNDQRQFTHTQRPTNNDRNNEKKVGSHLVIKDSDYNQMRLKNNSGTVTGNSNSGNSMPLRQSRIPKQDQIDQALTAL